MAERAAIARPYADAAFAVTAGGDAGRIDAWAAFLARAAAVVGDERIAQLLNNPHADKPRLLELVAEIACADAAGAADAAGTATDTAQQRNLLKLLSANGRLAALPAIASRFEQLRAESQGTVDAELVAAFAVGDEQQSTVAEALSRKLGRRVRLSAREDRGLIGGAIVRAGDLVIDASVRGQLQQLAAALDA
ncbi:MAG: F0F1 ATP synthase subunit delta [Gammaproteobacteria bacterium]|nr:F0F1 ATP synthase subunit delta [Gammaproteobacteria bacterium]